ncbi:MAG: hypothetical protein NTW03_16655, partial [Verrucomicrobia bacterium]|nr:hypothetical protein [Verrucomicrobiota bacterium]
RLVAAALLVGTSALADDAASLRLAITDLTATYGEHYPRGMEFLKRLGRMETTLGTNAPTASADFLQLQREALLANPLVCDQPLLFVVRRQYQHDHHNTATFFPSAQSEYNDGAFTPGGALKAIHFARGGEARTLLDLPHGVIRDPEIYFDGRKIVFSMRTNTADSYHIYEINADGSGLRQLTFAAAVDDLDPLYLPDDRIAFSSTREPKYCGCNRHIMANLFRMEADGANIHQIGKSTLFEGHGSLMPDGRILYDRWEYVDRNFGDAQALWTVNPDGTGHAVYWGNNTASPGAVIDARIIPGTDRAICVFGSCHDLPWGALAIIDRGLGLDGRGPVVRTWPADATNLIKQSGWQIFDNFTHVKLKYEDPYPLSDKYFLASRMTGQGEQTGLYLLDIFGNEILLHAEAPGCFDPMPLGPRPRPPSLAPRRDFDHQPGYFYVQDVYQGSSVAGVRRGTVKWLRVVESPEKRFWTHAGWNGQGQEAPAMNWHDFGNKRILGTVPVETDGSAYFEVPADRFVFFQLLDENMMMVQSMRSGTIAQAGERAGCIGCHEERRLAAPNGNDVLALRRPPSKLQGWYGPPREFNYLADVQPVFDKHCLQCHDSGQKAAQIVNLARDRDLVFNVSYNELWRKRMIKVIGAGPSETQAALAWGAHASKLGQLLLKDWKHKLTAEEFERVVTWMDLNAPYYPSFACAYPGNLAGRSPLDNPQLARLEELTGVPLRRQAGCADNQGPQVCFDRPELSRCLGKLSNPDDPKRQAALTIIRAGAQSLARNPEADSPGFIPCPTDQWREKKYQAREETERRNREAMREGRKQFENKTGS